MKTCTACNVRQHDSLVDETTGTCVNANQCLENKKRGMADLAELYTGLISISHAITGWQKRCAAYAVESGFRAYDQPVTREAVAVFCSNLHSEVSELWEAFRDGKLNAACNKAEKMTALGLPPMTCAEEELADIVIRCLDTADALGVDLMRAIVAKHVFNTTRSFQHGGKKA
jgi:NTP pyrophosphatase (non-canonical NTP hydrolase)